MKLIGKILIVIVLIILPTNLLARELRVVLDRDYPPFTYIDKEGNLVGICVEFWKLFAEKTGIKVKLIPVEWAKAHEMMINREADVIDTIFELVKSHPVKGEELISKMEELEDIAKMIRYHHERWDGKGYPEGLSGEDIPLEARILAVADAFDAMTSERPYKRALTIKEAIEELKRCSGTQFEPRIVDVMVSILEEESSEDS